MRPRVLSLRNLGMSNVILASLVPIVLAQTTRPGSGAGKTDIRPAESSAAAPARPKAYDPWTSKEMTGDWGGARTALADLGIRFDLSYQQQFQQNWHGGLDTHHGHEFSGTYDFDTRLDFAKMKWIPTPASSSGPRAGTARALTPGSAPQTSRVPMRMLMTMSPSSLK